MRDDSGVAAADDLTLLLVAVLAFTLFFSSLAASFIGRSSAERSERLEDEARQLLAAVRDGPKWTERRGVLLGSALDDLSSRDLAPFAGGHAFRVTIWDLATDRRWVLENGSSHGEQRTAATSANVVSERVDPARITATVWAA